MGVAVAGMLGCAERKPDWYDYSRDTTDWKERRIEEHMEQGLSEEEASRAFASEHAMWQTDTMRKEDGVVVEGADLQEGFEP